MSPTGLVLPATHSISPDEGLSQAPARLKALIFDLDGTLYRQGPLRRAIALRLLRAYALKPAEAVRVLRALRAYRSAQELLRKEGTPNAGAPKAQLQLASAITGFKKEFISTCVTRWMEREPLAILRRHLRRDVMPLLLLAKARGLRLAILSDYPAAAKLAALELASFFDVAVCAQDCEVECFKPDSVGLKLVLARLNVSADEVLYIGDRADVDASVALRTGVKCLLLNGKERDRAKWQCIPLSSFTELTKALHETDGPRWD